MVSDNFSISAPTLQKLVKAVTGQTFLVYVERQRLTRAREMLSSCGHSIQEISSLCGFSNTNSFYKAFKRLYRYPPSDALNAKKTR
jgi:AraC-like DNA-binding protein